MGKGWTWRKIRETRVENGPRGASLFERMLGLLLLVILLVHPTQITIPQILWFAKEQPEGGPAALGSIARLNLTVADALIFATFGLWFLWRLVPVWKRERMRLVPWPVIFLTIFAILSLLESLKPRDMLMMGQSFDAKDGVKELVQFAEFFIIALVLFRNLLTDRLLLKKALTLLVIVFTVVIIVGWTQFARFRPPGTEGASEGPRAMAIVGTFGVQAAETQRHEIAGTGSNRNVLSAYLAMAIPMLWGIAVFGTGIVRLWAFGLALAGLPLVLSGGALIGSVAGICAVSFLRREGCLFMVVALLLVFFGIIFSVLPQQPAGALADSVLLFKQKDRYELLGGDARGANLMGKVEKGAEAEGVELWPWQQRYVEWQAALNGMRWNPWFGVGIGNYQRNVTFFANNPEGAYYTFKGKPRGVNLMEEGANNYWAVLGMEMGVPALFAMAWLMLHCGAKALKGVRESSRGPVRAAAAGAVGALVSMVVFNFFTPMMVRGVGILAVLVFAMCEATATLNDSASSDAD